MIHESLPAILLLLVCVNGAPIIARIILAERFTYPLDMYRDAWDGRRLLGSSKTFRGVLAAALAGALLSSVIHISPMTGLSFGLAAMLGDSIASFIKRRLGLQSSEAALGLDQLPEALLPLLIIRTLLDISWPQLFTIAFAFLITQLFISPILYLLKIRRRPL